MDIGNSKNYLGIDFLGNKIPKSVNVVLKAKSLVIHRSVEISNPGLRVEALVTVVVSVNGPFA